MNEKTSEKLIEIIEFYKKNIKSEDRNIREFSKRKYENYVNYSKKYNINIENIIKSEETILSSEEYINNICKNQDIKNKIENYNTILKNNIENLNEEFINTWVNSYKDFAEKNNLDKNQMIIYANKQIKSITKEEYIIDDNFKLNKNKIVKGKEKEEEIQNDKSKDTKGSLPKNDVDELKIISRKKGKHSKKDIAILTGISLASIGLLGVPALIYVLFKFKDIIKYKFKINGLLKKYKIKQNEDGTLIDEEGKIIDSNYKDKNMYNMIKQELIKLESKVSKGKIRNLYKKNKLTSKLLNNKIIVNLKNKLKYKIEEKEELTEIQDIKKCMGAVK